MNKSKKLLVFLSAIVMLMVVMCFSASAASLICPDTISGEHVWWSREKVDATCEKDGYNRMVCYYCGDEKTETIPAKGGSCDFRLESTYSCSEVYECSGCGTYKYVVIDSSKHKLDPETGDTVDATCISDGYSYLECDYCCEEVLVAVYPARGYHIWDRVDYNGDVSSCNPDYWEEMYCYDCGASKRVTGATGGHAYDWDFDTVEPTCSKDGYSRKYCMCGAYYEEILYATNSHDWLVSNSKKATCTEGGWKEWFCEYGCGATKREDFPAAGHTYLHDWAEILAPSCTGQGVKIKVCNECSFVNFETLAALGHSDADADEICDSCSLALSEKAETEDKNEDKNEEEKPAETPDDNASESGENDTILTMFNRLIMFFEKLTEFFESIFAFVK